MSEDKTRIDKHKRNCSMGHTEKSSVIEHAFTDGDHRLLFDEIDVLGITQSTIPKWLQKSISIGPISTGKRNSMERGFAR